MPKQQSKHQETCLLDLICIAHILKAFVCVTQWVLVTAEGDTGWDHHNLHYFILFLSTSSFISVKIIDAGKWIKRIKVNISKKIISNFITEMSGNYYKPFLVMQIHFLEITKKLQIKI